MWCPECNISGGCDCYPPTGIKYIPLDHEKELERYEAGIKADIVYELEERKRRETLFNNVKHI